MQGLPKTHKPEIPLRPIKSGIGSVPHHLAKLLAKSLCSTLGKISDAHLRNSGHLISTLKDVNMRNKILMGFDVKSLFTNVPVVEAIEAAVKTLDYIDEERLCVRRTM